MNIFLTGASGFIGSKLRKVFATREGFVLTSLFREPVVPLVDEFVHIQRFDVNTNFCSVLKKQDCVIHAAAKAHCANEDSRSVYEMRRVNIDLTLNLARQASRVGVKRFIFISSIKVNGGSTPREQPFKSEDIPAPEDAYGLSKLEAEQGLLKIAHETGMEVVIIRAPLVYGFGVKGNFLDLINLVKKGIPLPLGSISNKRSLVSLDNLVDLIVTCVDHPKSPKHIFLAGDGQDLSSTELIKQIAIAAEVQVRLIPVNGRLLMFCCLLVGKKFLARRILGSLQVDISTARDVLGWTPPLSVEEGLRRCFNDGEHV